MQWINNYNQSMEFYRPPTQLIEIFNLSIKLCCIAILYRIVTTQHLDTDTQFLVYRTSLIILNILEFWNYAGKFEIFLGIQQKSIYSNKAVILTLIEHSVLSYANRKFF